ncbi:MAG TPA: YihY/virulence factor BrkB family protein [Candidatus Baltobacteraceae bacterium]|nr:YihY/virulence factor BrkB family protein [Candidatus Baltobacteraceae bacterium]
MKSSLPRGVAAFGSLVKETVAEFQRHKAPWLAAAIAYFALFAIAPLMIVVVEIAGLFLGSHRVVLDQLHGYLAQTAGVEAARGIDAIVTSTFSQRRSGFVAQTAGWVAFVLGAVGFFGSLQEALNTIWDVKPEKSGFLKLVKEKIPSFVMVLGVAFVLLISLALNSVVSAAEAATATILPVFPLTARIVDTGLSLVLVTLVFGLLYEYLPDCRIAWRDVWLGAATSAILFVAGQTLLAWYIGRAAVASSYGAFGGIVVFLVWAFYSAQIFLLGAEFAHVYALKFGSLRSTSQSRSMNKPE